MLLLFVSHPIANLFLCWGVIKHSFFHSFDYVNMRVYVYVVSMYVYITYMYYCLQFTTYTELHLRYFLFLFIARVYFAQEYIYHETAG